MADNLPMIEWQGIGQSGRAFTWVKRGPTFYAPDLRAALNMARNLYGAEDVLRADHVASFGGWEAGQR